MHLPKQGLNTGSLLRCMAWGLIALIFAATSVPGQEATPASRKSDHWAFQSPVLPHLPAVKQKEWVRTPIDAFVLARLESAGIQPPPAADRRTLLRRVYLDIIGLPPTPEEQRRFLNNTAPNAWEKVVDDLLSRPQYGERWARHWLDTVRYAETNGYERDGNKPNAWLYRDYVIAAFNNDKPFARFVTEQIAGDEMADASAETMTAASFLRLGSYDDEPPDKELDRYDQLDDVLGTTATAFLGITLRCARCHDHKFEPFTQKDYYRLLSVFAPLQRPPADNDRIIGTHAELAAYKEAVAKADAQETRLLQEAEPLRQPLRLRLFELKKTSLPPEAIAAFRAAPNKRDDAQKELVRKFAKTLNIETRPLATPEVQAKLDDLDRQIAAINAVRPKEPPRAYLWQEEGTEAPKVCILAHGDPAKRGLEVSPALPEVLVSHPPPPPPPTATTTGRRLWLAHWLTQPDNPLVSRVFVNRIWQHHFGEGLVATANDFGVMGRRPTHPELLDWLAVTFLQKPGAVPGDATRWACDGSLKKLHRLILLSNTYKASAAARPDALKKDPDNALLSRWHVRRLEAEAIRDTMLAVSGQINLQSGGPSIYPPLPQEVLQGQSRPGDGWGKSDERQAARRGIYIFIKRSLAVPEMEALDTPDTSSSCETRIVSTVAPQALTFMNGAFTRQQAHAFAERLRREVGDDPQKQIERAFALALCRAPAPTELKTAADFLIANARQIEADAKAVKQAPGEARQKALDAFCLILLNSNEFFYTN